jgi:hypothetical protein
MWLSVIEMMIMRARFIAAAQLNLTAWRTVLYCTVFFSRVRSNITCSIPFHLSVR